MLKYWNYDIVFSEIPDEVTLAVNLTCCPNGCVGCHSPHLQHDIGGVLDWAELNRIIQLYASSITCICFMGGDGDPTEVARLADKVLSYYPDLCTAWYSGRKEIPEGFSVNSFKYIKVGPYIEKYGPLSSPTTNQRLYHIHDGKMDNITCRFQN